MPQQALGDRQTATWVWLSQPEIDFGGTKPARTGDERTIWLHADPFRALGLPHSSKPEEVRRARRRLARIYHPDVSSAEADSLGRFQEIESAARVIEGETELLVEPISGAWWRFVGFSRPSALRSAAQDSAVAGLTFEIHDLTQVPSAQAADTVRISYADQVLPLVLRYSGSRFAAPVLLARAGAFAESTVLILLCLTIIPIVAVLLALDVFALSDRNVFLTWAIALLILTSGYGALVAILASAGRRVPYPRRAILRTRAAVADLRSLARGRV